MWKVLRRAEKCNDAYYCDKQRRAAYSASVSTRISLPMSGYVREQTTSLLTRKCLRRRDEEAFGKRLRSAAFFFWSFSRFFLLLYLASFAQSGFSLLETEAPLLSRPLFPTRKRSLRRFVSEGEAVVTNFAPPPSTLILIRENTIRGSAAAGLTENFLPTNPPWKIRSMFSTFFNEIDLLPKINMGMYSITYVSICFCINLKSYFLFIRILHIMKICDIYRIIDRRLTEKRIEQDINYFKIQSIFCNVIYIRIFPVDLYKVNRNMSGYKIVFCIKCCSYRQLL